MHGDVQNRYHLFHQPQTPGNASQWRKQSWTGRRLLSTAEIIPTPWHHLDPEHWISKDTKERIKEINMWKPKTARKELNSRGPSIYVEERQKRSEGWKKERFSEDTVIGVSLRGELEGGLELEITGPCVSEWLGEHLLFTLHFGEDFVLSAQTSLCGLRIPTALLRVELCPQKRYIEPQYLWMQPYLETESWGHTGWGWANPQASDLWLMLVFIGHTYIQT